MVFKNQFYLVFYYKSLRIKKLYKKQRNKLCKSFYISVLSHIASYLEDDDHRAVDFNGETISFKGQPTQIY